MPGNGKRNRLHPERRMWQERDYGTVYGLAALRGARHFGGGRPAARKQRAGGQEGGQFRRGRPLQHHHQRELRRRKHRAAHRRRTANARQPQGAGRGTRRLPPRRGRTGVDGRTRGLRRQSGHGGRPARKGRRPALAERTDCLRPEGHGRLSGARHAPGTRRRKHTPVHATHVGTNRHRQPLGGRMDGPGAEDGRSGRADHGPAGPRKHDRLRAS